MEFILFYYYKYYFILFLFKGLIDSMSDIKQVHSYFRIIKMKVF